MKKAFIIFLLCILSDVYLYAQDGEEPPQGNERKNNFGFDFDTIFDNTAEEIPDESGNSPPINLRDKIMLEASYGFVAGFSPGWDEVPWYSGEKKNDYIIGAQMDALLSMDFSLTDELRVHNSFYFSLPDSPIFSIKEFFFEYNIRSKAFFKAGFYEIAWGISRFYPFTNLPSLVPADKENWGGSYIGKLSIPIGIGGIDFIAITRWGYIGNTSSPQFNEFGYGIKYNYAVELADIDIGFLYHKELPLRFFVSLKTTLGNTELYSEGLVAVSSENGHETRFSGNIGLLRDFFKGSLTLAGEIFYNGEPDSAWWRTKTELLEEAKVELYQGINGAFAFIFRPGFWGMRIFGQVLYSYEENSAWLIPGISIKPNGITLSVSAPMALGNRPESKDPGNYYRNNTDKNNRPFSIVLGINYRGKLRYVL